MLQYSEDRDPRRRTEEWDDLTSNRDQQYFTHGIFRYFGKLPPSITARIFQELNLPKNALVIDLMCGSGTTLVEAGARGYRATGVDCNDLSVAVSTAKTRTGALEVLGSLLEAYQRDVGKLAVSAGGEWRPPTRNIDHWFAPEAQTKLSSLREWLLPWLETPAGPGTMSAFSSCVRPASNASVRIGRLFRETNKNWSDPFVEFPRRVRKLIESLEALAKADWEDERVSVRLADGRSSGLDAGSADVVWLHPPYFALYKYSSDVLRLELDWLGLDRKKIVKREILDGFKTTNAGLVKRHLGDLRELAVEAYRLAKPGGSLIIVTADSTLRDTLLPIVSPLIEQVEHVGWRLARRAERKVRFAQASYHRSANAKIQRPNDEVMFFVK